MFAIVFVTLLLVTAVIGILGAAMFYDVAFAGPRPAFGLAPGSRGRPRGTEHRAFDGVELARRIEQTVSRTVASLGSRRVAVARCDATCHEREIQVTVPEVLAIVEELRERQSPSQVEAIRLRAQQSLVVQNSTHHCPLLLSGGFCACEMSRPVSCRTRCIAGADSPAEAKRLAESVETGVTEIFRDCLSASGLDDERYELNSALTQVMNTPRASKRWARGEQILKPSAAMTNDA